MCLHLAASHKTNECFFFSLFISSVKTLPSSIDMIDYDGTQSGRALQSDSKTFSLMVINGVCVS